METSGSSSIDKEPLVYMKANWWRFVILFAFIILVLLAVGKHEPFVDEGQSWLIARDASPISVIFRYARYDGHPFLWYTLLMLPAKLGLPYIFLNIISALIAAVTIYLILWRSPFPTIIKISLPFTYFFAFQYSVVARCYVLVPLLLFCIAIIYKSRTRRPFLFTVLLCLLANVTLPATIVATSILIVHALDLLRNRSSLDSKTRKNNGIAMVIFAACFGFVLLQMWPTADATTNIPTVISAGHFWYVFVNYFLDGTITNYWFITLPVLLASLAWFWRRKVFLLYVLPTLLHLIFVSLKPASIYNQGIFLVVWVFVLWISFDGTHSELTGNKTNRVLYITIICAMLVVIGLQISWSVKAYVTDHRHYYSGTFELASFIKENDLEQNKIFMVGGQSATGVLPYFRKNIYANYNNGGPPSFWFSSKKNKTPARLTDDVLASISKELPDIVVVSMSATDAKSADKLNRMLQGAIYGLIGPFTGTAIWRNASGIEPSTSYWVLYNKKQFNVPRE